MKLNGCAAERCHRSQSTSTGLQLSVSQFEKLTSIGTAGVQQFASLLDGLEAVPSNLRVSRLAPMDLGVCRLGKLHSVALAY